MAKYRKKPVELEAIRWDYDNVQNVNDCAYLIEAMVDGRW